VKQFAEAYRGRRVLVTGHTGFKGSWLVMWLQHLGAEVSGFSDRVPTSPAMFDLLGLDGRISHHLGDIRDRARLGDVMDEARPAVVFHLAAQALVLDSHTDPVTTFETNAMGMVNLLECVRERPWIDVVVLVTSDKAYRNNEWEWGYRETDVLAGLDPYSGSKSCAEIVAHSYHHSFLGESATRTATARAGNVIGGGDWATDRIVPDCIRAWSSGNTVTVRRPLATRPWQHVLEPLSGYLWLGASLLDEGAGLDGEAFNFGPDSQQDLSVQGLIDAMASRWPGAGWQEGEDPDGAGREATLLRLSCDKALRVLGWRAVLQLPTTVEMTVDWYRRWRDGDPDLHGYTTMQIEQYTEVARSAGLSWSTG
jgi:CDP-glucose 4,6-dehydratase